MNNITLISDWKLRDPYISIFKGLVLKKMNNANFIDISHAIPLCDISQTAFILKWSYPSFPDGTLHLILTGAVNNPELMPVWVKYGNHYFMGTDNGVFSLLFDDDEPEQARVFNGANSSESFFDKIIKMIVWHFEGSLVTNTLPYDSFKPCFRQVPYLNKETRQLTGHVAYIDSFCNAITDIPVSMFKEAAQGKPFHATVSATQYITISKYSDYYQNFGDEVYLVANQFGFLEITMYRAHIAILGNIQVGDEVKISF